jgi:hypothetical protein
LGDVTHCLAPILGMPDGLGEAVVFQVRARGARASSSKSRLARATKTDALGCPRLNDVPTGHHGSAIGLMAMEDPIFVVGSLPNHTGC